MNNYPANRVVSSTGDGTLPPTLILKTKRTYRRPSKRRAMLQAPIQLPTSPHVIVVGNEKGGSGKTTIAIHIALALMKAGQRVATIDLDSRQKSLTHYIENRRAWAQRTGIDLELPTHFSVARAEGARVDQNEAIEFGEFDKAVTAVQDGRDFVVIDTPPHDSYLMRLA